MEEGQIVNTFINADPFRAPTRTNEDTSSEKAKLECNKWTDDVIRRLILLWGERPALYDTKHEWYFSKNKRRDSMLEICEDLNMSFHEIQLKMVSLRTYYGSQQRKKIAWENDPTKTSPFKSRWQFWTPLQFLQDHMTQKPAENKTTYVLEDDCQSPELLEDFDKDESDDSKTQIPRFRAAKRKVEKNANSMDLEINTRCSDNVEESTEKRTRTGKEFSSRSDDELFATVILKSLGKIEEGEAKEALKLEIQNLIFRTRFGPQNSVVNYVQGAYTNHYMYGNSFVRGNSEIQVHTNNGSDEEPTMAGRRKPINPKRSTQGEISKM